MVYNLKMNNLAISHITDISDTSNTTCANSTNCVAPMSANGAIRTGVSLGATGVTDAAGAAGAAGVTGVTGVAVIVEPRRHKALGFVLKNMLDNLPTDWNILIFHGLKNHAFLNTILSGLVKEERERIIKRNLNIGLMTILGYNNLLKSKEFWLSLPAETVLIFQTDSMINPLYKDRLSKFLEYDYVGAPWCTTKKVGNGGFSLRKRSKMLEILDKCALDERNEDEFLSCPLTDDVVLKKPTPELAAEFSVETLSLDKIPFGTHKIWRYKLRISNYREILNNFPGLKTLIELNKK